MRAYWQTREFANASTKRYDYLQTYAGPNDVTDDMETMVIHALTETPQVIMYGPTHTVPGD
jgi:hypothetical protein